MYDVTSDTQDITCGVPKGSVFYIALLYINDIPKATPVFLVFLVHSPSIFISYNNVSSSKFLGVFVDELCLGNTMCNS